MRNFGHVLWSVSFVSFPSCFVFVGNFTGMGVVLHAPYVCSLLVGAQQSIRITSLQRGEGNAGKLRAGRQSDGDAIHRYTVVRSLSSDRWLCSGEGGLTD